MILNNTKVGIFSDLHLGVHQNSRLWYKIASEWADWCILEFKERGIKDIFFGGDWWHYRDSIEVSTINFGSDLLKKFKDFNLYFIVGNHDAYLKDTSEINSLSIFNGYSNVTVFNQMHTECFFGKSITFCPWGTPISDIPKSDIVIGHFEIQNFKFNDVKVCSHGFTSEDVCNKGKLVISGHLHVRQERIYDNSTILYVGNPFQMDYGDMSDRKGIYILDITTLSYEFIENKISPLHKKIRLSEMIKEPGLTDKLRGIFEGNIVKLIIDRNISSEDSDILYKSLQTLKPAIFTTEITLNNPHNDINYVNTDLECVDINKVIEEFVEALDINNKKDVIKYTQELYLKCSQ